MSEQIPYNPGGMRRFRIDRAEKGWITSMITRRLGDGREVTEPLKHFHSKCIAQCCVFAQGFTVARFFPDGEDECRTETFETIEELLQKYPESSGSYRIRWEDMCCFRCGSTIDVNFGPGTCSACGASWNEPSDWPRPSEGSWMPIGTVGG